MSTPEYSHGTVVVGGAGSYGAAEYLRYPYEFVGAGWAVACWGLLQITGGGGNIYVTQVGARTLGNPTRAELRLYPPGFTPRDDTTWVTSGEVVTTLTFGGADEYGNRYTPLRSLVYDGPGATADGIATLAVVIFGTQLAQPTGGLITVSGEQRMLLGGVINAGVFQSGLLPFTYLQDEPGPPTTSTARQQLRASATLTHPYVRIGEQPPPEGTAFPAGYAGPAGVTSPRGYIDLLTNDTLTLTAGRFSVSIPRSAAPTKPAPPTVELAYWDPDGAEHILATGAMGELGFQSPDGQYWTYNYDAAAQGPITGSTGYAGPGRFGYAIRVLSAYPLVHGGNYGVDLAVTATVGAATTLSPNPFPIEDEEPPDEETPTGSTQPGDVLTVSFPTDPASYGTPQDYRDGVTWDTPVPCRAPAPRRVAPGRAPAALPQLGRAAAYRVQILTRGGGQLAYDVPDHALTALTWERRVNETAEHTVELAKRTHVAGHVLAYVGDPWAYEVAIWRVPQYGPAELAAVGPIVDWTETRTTLTLAARDITAWFGKRAIHHDFAFTGCTDLAEIARWMIADAIAPDDPGLLPGALFFPTGISVTRSGVGNTLMLDSELADLAGLGLDYTVVGRRLVVSGDLAGQWPHVARLGDHHIDGDLEVNLAGGETVTRVWKVGGSGTTSTSATAAAVLGYAGGVDPLLGLLESVEDDSALTTNATARTAARVALAAGYPTPQYVRVPDDAGLAPTAPVTLDMLVPGVGMHVHAAGFYRPVGQVQRLTRVQGTWDADAGERIAVSLAPWAQLVPDDAGVLATPVSLGTFDQNVATEPAETLTEPDFVPLLEPASVATEPGADPDDGTVTVEGGADDGTTPSTDEVPLAETGGDPGAPDPDQ